jgi:hypothetical protein
LQDLVASAPLDVGQVTAVSGGSATVALQGGGEVNARGAATVGQRVYVRGGVVESVAPNLPFDAVEV